MNTRARPTWNARDERMLQDLRQRHQAFLDDNTPAVRAVILQLYANLSNNPTMLEGTVKVWIDNADSIRDALAPFDSGVRAGSPSTSG